MGRRKWTNVEDYPTSNRRSWRFIFLVWIASAGIGTAYGAGWLDVAPRSSAAPAADIEWNEVQAVPTRQLAPDELAWQRRGRVPVVMAADDGDAPQKVDIVRGADHGSAKVIAPAPGIEVIRGTGRASEHAEKRAGKWQRIYAYDGDTFTLGDGRRVRIAGIDAPEIHPPRCAEEKRLGEAAQAKLQQLLDSGTVTMSGSRHDQYGRELRNVRVNGQDVGEAMIAAGLARSYDGKKRRPWC